MPSDKLKKISTPYLVLCEGSHDREFLKLLFSEIGLTDLTVCSNYGLAGIHGNTAFGKSLDVLTGVAGFESLKGIVIVTDSDRCPLLSLENVRQQISETEIIYGPQERRFPMPSAVHTWAFGAPSICVVLIPSEHEEGNLEALLLAAVLEDAPILSCLAEFIACVGADQWHVNQRSKFALRLLVGANNPAEPEVSFSKIWDCPEVKNLIPISSPAFNRLAQIFISILASSPA